MWMESSGLGFCLKTLQIGTCLVFMSTTCSFAQASKLDVPIGARATIRSEIKRGEDAGSQCLLKARDNYVFFVGCLIGETHSHQTSDPFLLGLFVVARATGQSVEKDSAWLPKWGTAIARIIDTYRLSKGDLCAAFVMKCEIVRLAAFGDRGL
jgi:hypothetical protein